MSELAKRWYRATRVEMELARTLPSFRATATGVYLAEVDFKKCRKPLPVRRPGPGLRPEDRAIAETRAQVCRACPEGGELAVRLRVVNGFQVAGVRCGLCGRCGLMSLVRGRCRAGRWDGTNGARR